MKPSRCASANEVHDSLVQSIGAARLIGDDVEVNGDATTTRPLIDECPRANIFTLNANRSSNLRGAVVHCVSTLNHANDSSLLSAETLNKIYKLFTSTQLT